MNFLGWNEAIGKHFFNTDRMGARVFFYVTDDVLNEIGAQANVDKDDFLAAVKVGPPWNTRLGRGICQQALQTFENWRDRHSEYPPYLCYLALFVWADSVDVGFAKHAYYPGLRSLLGENPESGMYPSFNQMYLLWDDLAIWSNIDRHGDLGIFDADIVGEWLHVGLPRAQTLLTDREREKLPSIFANNGFDPHSPPSEKELAYLLAEDPNHYLRTHTKQLLRSAVEKDAARTALIDTILEQLEHWDCSVTDIIEGTSNVSSLLANLRLAMTVDRTARIVRFSLRCRSNRAYPEEGLLLRAEGRAELLSCNEDWQGWSTPIHQSAAQMLMFDASTLDWRAGLSLADHEHGWKASLSKRPVRVMVSAKKFGFDGFIEESQLPQGEMFYLLAHSDHAETLRTWGQVGCKGFAEPKSFSGLPEHWCLFSVDRAESDVTIGDIFPFLAFPSELRINLRGGLKVRGSQYFSFALPQIELTGLGGTVEVLCNNSPLKVQIETGLYSIPNELAARRLIIEVRRGDESVRKKSLYSVEKLAWRDVVPLAKLDKFGRRISGEAHESFVGPIVEGVAVQQFSPEVFLPPSVGHRTYYIGKNIGEIIEYPTESIPKNWKPVWAVIMKKGAGCATYCGMSPLIEEPSEISFANQKRRRLWREVLWHWRKRISFPPHQTLSSLWKKYRKVARHGN